MWNSRVKPSVVVLRACLAGALAALLGACATTTAPERSGAVAVSDAGGFTITEEVAINEATRADFDAALAALEEARYDRGIALLASVAERAPQVTAVHINLGIAYARSGDFEKAEASLRKALVLNPRHPVAHNELGMVYRRTGRFREARTSYEAALAIHPGFHFARRNLAVLCDMYLADYECALENYTRYNEAVPSDQEAAMWIADLRNRAGAQETP